MALQVNVVALEAKGGDEQRRENQFFHGLPFGYELRVRRETL